MSLDTSDSDVRTGARRRHTGRIVTTLVMLLVLGAGAMACGSGGGSGDVERVGLAELNLHQEEFSGDDVETSGVVRRFDDIGGTYYVIEDADQNRVRVEPPETFVDLVGDRIVVTGRFAYDDTRGRRLTVTRVHPPT